MASQTRRTSAALAFTRKLAGPGPFLLCLAALPALWLLERFG